MQLSSSIFDIHIIIWWACWYGNMSPPDKKTVKSLWYSGGRQSAWASWFISGKCVTLSDCSAHVRINGHKKMEQQSVFHRNLKVIYKGAWHDNIKFPCLFSNIWNTEKQVISGPYRNNYIKSVRGQMMRLKGVLDNLGRLSQCPHFGFFLLLCADVVQILFSVIPKSKI